MFHRFKSENRERLSSSARLLAALLKGFRFRHHKRSIPLEHLKLLLGSLIASIFCAITDSAFLGFVRRFLCVGEGVLGSTDFASLHLRKEEFWENQLLNTHTSNRNRIQLILRRPGTSLDPRPVQQTTLLLEADMQGICKSLAWNAVLCNRSDTTHHIGHTQSLLADHTAFDICNKAYSDLSTTGTSKHCFRVGQRSSIVY